MNSELLHFIAEFLNFRNLVKLMKTSKFLHSEAKKLRKLDVELPVTESSFDSILQLFHQARFLTIRNASNLGIYVMLNFGTLNQLDTLRIENIADSNSSSNYYNELDAFLPTSNLRSIHLKTVSCSSDLLVVGLTWHSKLQEVTLEECFFLEGEYVYNVIFSLRELITLKIINCVNVYNIVSSEATVYMSPVGSSIRSFSIVKSPMLVKTPDFHNLLYCNVSMTSISSENVSKLIACNKQLESLVAESCHRLCYINISSLSLKSLNVNYSASLEQIQVNCPNMNFLTLHQCYAVRELRIYSDKLTDLNCQLLSELTVLDIYTPLLIRLNLNGCARLGTVDPDANTTAMSQGESNSRLRDNTRRWRHDMERLYHHRSAFHRNGPLAFSATAVSRGTTSPLSANGSNSVHSNNNNINNGNTHSGSNNTADPYQRHLQPLESLDISKQHFLSPVLPDAPDVLSVLFSRGSVPTTHSPTPSSVHSTSVTRRAGPHHQERAFQSPSHLSQSVDNGGVSGQLLTALKPDVHDHVDDTYTYEDVLLLQLLTRCPELKLSSTDVGGCPLHVALLRQKQKHVEEDGDGEVGVAAIRVKATEGTCIRRRRRVSTLTSSKSPDL